MATRALANAAAVAGIIAGLLAVAAFAPPELKGPLIVGYLVLMLGVFILTQKRSSADDPQTSAQSHASVRASQIGKVEIDQSHRTYNIAAPASEPESALPLAPALPVDAVISKSDEPRPSRRPRRRPALSKRVMNVASGDARGERLDAVGGEQLEGFVEEVEGDPFDAYILDSRNFARFKRKEEFLALWESEDEAYAPIKFRIPKNRKGPFYLAISARGKQYDRKVRIDLETIGRDDE